MSFLTLEVSQWAQEQFGSCKLGDARRTRRAVKVAAQCAQCPDSSTPDQFERWSALKATYRLFHQKGVTFTALATPHWKRTRTLAKDVCLLINDTTEVCFGYHHNATGLGPTGAGTGHGFMLHSSLMVQAQTRDVIGMAAAELFHRRRTGRSRESSYHRARRRRESEVWGRVIDRVGPPPDGVRYLHVGDRGADNIEVFCHCREQQCGWVIRAAQFTRFIESPDGKRLKLKTWLADQPVLGTYELKVRTTSTEAERTARLEVRAAPAILIPPRQKTPYIRRIGPIRISEWVVEAREVNPPKGVTPVRWVLHTSEETRTFEDAWRILEYYETRWVIEEYHKCLKTGCRLESRMYMTAARLEAVAGMLSVLAVRLLQLKFVAKQQPDLPAERVVPKAWLDMLRALRQSPIRTVRDFFRHLAGLGGFLMRKGDGEPGWITLWRGLKKLLQCLRGARAIRQRCG